VSSTSPAQDGATSHDHAASRDSTDQSAAAAGGVTSQPIAQLIRREFELLRAAPSAELTTSQS